MKERALALGKYGISKDRYLELKYICRQYEEYRRKIRRRTEEIAGGFNDLSAKDTPRGSRTSDPTAERAMRLAKADIAELRVNAIKSAAMEAEQGIYKQILKNVTQGIPYERMNVPCGRRYFFEARRKFFWLLDQYLQ